METSMSKNSMPNQNNKHETLIGESELLIRFVTGLADDALILGQRLSELCRNGPYLEEDLALSNVALDYIGRASMFYQYAAELSGDGCTEDTLAFFRDERQFTNLLINELPNNDFAFTMVKQYFIDVFNTLYLEQLCHSNDITLSAIAAKAVKESRYHLKRSKPWIRQLAGGTDESLSRVEMAIDELQYFIGEQFLVSDWEQLLVDKGIAVDRTQLQNQWQQEVATLFKQCALSEVNCDVRVKGGRDGIHTEHLGHLLSEMQFLQRAYPGLEW